MTDPNLPVLVYDGDCGFCTASVEWLRRRLRSGSNLAIEPWQKLDLRALGLLPTDVEAAAWWVGPGGVRRRGHRAAARALRAARGAWPVVGWAMEVPPVSWLARLVYALVARYRYRLPGSTDACRVLF